MAGGCIVVEVTTSSSIELLLHSRASYAIASPAPAISLGAFNPASSGWVSTSPMLGTQWSPGPSSS
ncbi:hypothetical protein B296_00030105 [Ensete ventricosum]|uniref:Uncharacterized protein n=1 Tax=Ensete ventricosum TaxID=4639 RepID=A0A426YB80_ENSVE|nr:hypothetical protein B296_00030105 [Ensete ventricosum]